MERYVQYLKDNKAKGERQARTREIMQSIPDSAYKIPIRNFILRFRPSIVRISQCSLHRTAESRKLEIISWITRSKWLPGPLVAPVHWIFVFHFFHVGSDVDSAPTGTSQLLKVGKNIEARKWHRCSRYLSIEKRGTCEVA